MLNNLVEEYCVESLLDFYNNGNIGFAEYLDDNVVWYGPLEGQQLRGKDNLIKAFSSGKSGLKFNIEHLNTKIIPVKANAFTFIADYELYTYYPNGKVLKYNQHLLVVSRMKKCKDGVTRWVSPLIHVSDVLSRKGDKTQQSAYVAEFDKDVFDFAISNRGKVQKIVFSGQNNSNYYIPEDSILYIEGGKGVKSYVHTKDKTYTVIHLLKDIMEKLPNYYYRCHSSYIVNLKFVERISNYKVFLDNGEEIPVPVKKYSVVKEEINSFMEKNMIIK